MAQWAKSSPPTGGGKLFGEKRSNSFRGVLPWSQGHAVRLLAGMWDMSMVPQPPARRTTLRLSGAASTLPLHLAPETAMWGWLCQQEQSLGFLLLFWHQTYLAVPASSSAGFLSAPRWRTTEEGTASCQHPHILPVPTAGAFCPPLLCAGSRTQRKALPQTVGNRRSLKALARRAAAAWLHFPFIGLASACCGSHCTGLRHLRLLWWGRVGARCCALPSTGGWWCL